MRSIVSYADKDQDHTGIIYQAINWLYLGCVCENKKDLNIMVNGIKKNTWLPFMRLQNRELSEPYKFLIYRNNMRNENPYGTSDLLSCYWA